MTRITMLAGVSALALATSSVAHAGTLWISNITQAGENPPTGAPYTGTGFLVLNDAENSASVTATHNVPANVVTGGHIHRGPAGVNGPIILPFPSPASPVGPITWAIPAADVANLKSGGLYFNFHTAANPGGAIRGQISRALLAPSAANASQLAVANALDVSAGYTADLDRILMSAAVATPDARSQTLGDLSGQTLFAGGRQVLDTMVDFEDSLFAHGETAAAAGQTGVALFATAAEAFGKRDAEMGQAGSKISRPSIMAGVDYASADGFRAGVSLGYAKGRDKFRDGLGRTEAETTAIHAFASTAADRPWVLSGVAGYGWTSFNTSRNLASLGRTATASPDGKTWSLGAKVSFPMTVSSLSVAPYGLVDAQHATVKAYSEAGADSVGLVVPKHTAESTAAEVGVALSVPMTPDADGLTGRLQLGWRHRLAGDDNGFATAFAGSPVVFQTTVHGPDDDVAHLAASVMGRLAPNLSASASYRAFLGSSTTAQAVELRLTLRM